MAELRSFAVPPADSIPVEASPKLFYRAVRALVIKPVVSLLFRVKVNGRENLPADGFVAIANHSGWADAMLLLSTLPPDPRPHLLGDPAGMIAKRAFGMPVGNVLWWGLKRMGGFICVDRQNGADPVMRRQAVKCLEIGGALALCPEGRYIRFPGEDPDALLPFKPGFAHFASQSGKPIVPIAMNGTRRLWWLKRIEINIGAPVATVGRDWREAGREARDSLAAMHRPDDARARFRPFERILTLGEASAASYATLGGSFL